ncbi:dead box RNA helicase, putative [Theileria annulata]|uniref:RNA helicase n=1 Tax=Theileria annulata TaxID=5874 RepID=Q4UAX1_THEAN|nr:dead box RNA helicase, putative [Theileria annulata]CAI76030.1 dead box RNA helicase, putative [Theileria annulata]|eukprot:XP_955506.1 dead box RNA helicase, putative [Theileria annulata]
MFNIINVFDFILMLFLSHLFSIFVTHSMALSPFQRITNSLNTLPNFITTSFNSTLRNSLRNSIHNSLHNSCNSVNLKIGKNYSFINSNSRIKKSSLNNYANYDNVTTLTAPYQVGYNNPNLTPNYTTVPNYTYTNYNTPNNTGYGYNDNGLGNSTGLGNGYGTDYGNGNSYRSGYGNRYGYGQNRGLSNNYNTYTKRQTNYFGPRQYYRYNTYRQTNRRFNNSRGYDIPVSLIDWEKEELVEIKKDFYDLSYEADSRPGEEIEKILKSHDIIIEGEHPLPKPVTTFDEAVFNEPIQKIIKESKFTEPTPIQKVGRDIIGVSQTGSGKTLTFLLPGLLHLLAQPPVGKGGPIMLVLSPTRELCVQIAEEAKPYSRLLNLRLIPIYGGTPKLSQVREIQNGAEIIVATPGRLLEYLSTGAIKLNRVSYFVMDEADRMLDMGFEPQIRKIMGQIRPDRQTLMFSATWPSEIKRLASEFYLELTANPNIKQNFEFPNSYEVKDNLFDFLGSLAPEKKVLIFSDLKSFADQLTSALRYRRFRAYSLHGNKTQNQRERILNMYRSGEFNILVATDVAARGLDIKDIDYVINLDVPKSLLDYIHRIGRTGRGNNKGESLLYFPIDTLSPSKVKFAQDLSNLLTKVNQTVPSQLTQIANNNL